MAKLKKKKTPEKIVIKRNLSRDTPFIMYCHF